MQAPAIPADEETRIDTLQTLQILDSGREERFDRLTRIAQRVFGVPIALINLVDEDRQWSKSSQGFDMGEIPRDQSICAHTILEDDILLVPDASRDERFSDNPLVVNDPKIRFYAGFPLKAANGSKLGTLCLIDRQAREFNEEDKALLRDLAKIAERELSAVELATLDELTLLSNRRGFESLSGHALELSRRFQRPAALLYFDLDQFKQINERFGQIEGDSVLKTFAQLLKLTFRESDVLGRLGDDDFAVLMTNASEAQLDHALDRLRNAVDQYNEKSQQDYDIAFSFGKLIFDASGHAAVGDLMAKADTLMSQHRMSKDN